MLLASTSSPIIHISTHLDPISTTLTSRNLLSAFIRITKTSWGILRDQHLKVTFLTHQTAPFLLYRIFTLWLISSLSPLSSPCPLALSPISWLTISKFIMASETLPALAHSPEGKGSHSPPDISTWSFPKKLKFSLFLMAHSDITIHPSD